MGVENHSGRRVVVLGASYGIGRATADLLADQGAHVVYASRRQDLLEEAIKNRNECHVLVIDASDEQSIASGMQKAVELLGGIDFVLYVPTYYANGSFEHLFESGNFASGYDNSFRLNLSGMFSSFEHSRKHLLKSKSGCFITLSSVLGSMGHPAAALYAIVKASVDAAIKQLALEYAPLGLRILSVAPGLVHTPAIDNMGPIADRFLKEVGDSHAMERYAEAEEVAEVLAFLCSERASFMTGGPIYVDGGAMLRSSLGDAIRSFVMESGEEQDKEL